jgi:hypothetical protein
VGRFIVKTGGKGLFGFLFHQGHGLLAMEGPRTSFPGIAVSFGTEQDVTADAVLRLNLAHGRLSAMPNEVLTGSAYRLKLTI